MVDFNFHFKHGMVTNAGMIPTAVTLKVQCEVKIPFSNNFWLNTVIPRLMKIIPSGITFVSQNVISHMLSGVSLLAVSNVNNPVGLVGLPYVMWSANFFVTHIQTEKISSWNGPTIHVCCFMLARACTKTFVSRVQKTAKKIFVSRKIR
jgi:hypothetical protein